MSEISDKNVLFCLSISEILFIISDLCAQWPSMTWHSLLPQEWDVILDNGDDHLLCT